MLGMMSRATNTSVLCENLCPFSARSMRVVGTQAASLRLHFVYFGHVPMPNEAVPPTIKDQPMLIVGLGWFAIVGCAVLCLSILIADFVVPNHDWVADTISDLAAGRYEIIVDIGLYTFSAALVAIALLAAHVHMGGWAWSVGLIGFAVFGLVVFLIGARNEYGDADSDGVVIHRYLVYATGVLMAVVPWCMASGAARAGQNYGRVLVGISILWSVSAPFFFILPTGVDGIYERYLGLIAMAAVVTLARLFIMRGRRVE